MSSAASANIARHLRLMADAHPALPALKVPRGRTRDRRIDYLTLSFAELEAEVGAWQVDLTQRGVRRGDRVLVMVRQGLPLIAAVFALFAHGAVPIVIDPGMGRKAFLACVARSRPRVLLGIPLARLVSRVFAGPFRSVEVRVPVAGSPTARLARAGAKAPCVIESRGPQELAAILFTSGSTGAPKGVCYEHGQFEAQVRLIRETYGIIPGEVDLPMLPIFALFNPALGMTTVVPEIDPSRPAQVDPGRVVQAIQQERVTNSFGSPTLWLKIARHCEQHRIQLPSLRRVLSAGAPVPPALWSLLRSILPNGELHSPYGATEALPVATISASEVLGETAARTLAGAGTCVGRPLKANDVRIIALSDQPLPHLAAVREQPRGQIGEIIVAGPTVTRSYDQLPDATARAKVHPSSTAVPATETGGAGDHTSIPPVFHRMGDCGYFDEAGRLWFCGRVAERVEPPGGPLFTEQVEPAFNAQPGVQRSALIGLGAVGQQIPAIVIEPSDPRVWASAEARRAFATSVLAALRQHPFASRVHRVFLHRGLPVDVRHNAKIHRLTLARWASQTEPIVS